VSKRLKSKKSNSMRKTSVHKIVLAASLCCTLPILWGREIKYPYFKLVTRDKSLPCKGLSNIAVQEAISKSSGQKKKYFEALREITGTSLTRDRYDTSQVRIITDSRNVLFAGDSVMGEICHSYMMITGQATVASNGKNRMISNATRCVGASGFFDPANARKVVMDATSDGTKFDMFVLGTTTHNLFGAPDGEDPLTEHRARVESHLRVYSDLANELGVPIVFVGSMPLDGRTILLSPPKHDWKKFKDFATADLWDAIETEVFQSRNVSGVHHFRPAVLTMRCPGIRCDGLHFGSDFQGWVCTRSWALWDHYLAHFLATKVRRNGGSHQHPDIKEAGVF